MSFDNEERTGERKPYAKREGSDGEGREGREGGARRRPFFKQRKSCPFQGENFKEIDYKNLRLLTRHISERGKITPRRITSVSQKAQRRLSREIKRARFLALLPYIRA